MRVWERCCLHCLTLALLLLQAGAFVNHELMDRIITALHSKGRPAQTSQDGGNGHTVTTFL